MHFDIDPQRWRAARDGFRPEAWEALPHSVRRSSKDLPWQGLSVWQQGGPVEDLYLPAVGDHCVILRRGPPTRLLQRQGDEMRACEWRTGEVLLVPAGTPTFWRSDQTRDNIHLDIAPYWLERAAGAPVRLQPCFGARDALLEGLGQALLQSLDTPTSLSREFADAMAVAIAIHLLERYADPAGTAPSCGLTARQLRRVTDFVRSHLRGPCDVARLAQETQLSPAHFARCFKASCGMTPHAFVQRVRMERARELLLADGASVAGIAQEVGFSSRAHFTQAFRRHWGTTPTALRRGA